ncbi:MAG: helix-turn-helix domain-containing protein [Nitrospiraceae bacterium]|nr:helix-turn-helix domain-containing protein [Nitrospiraceae bacterium]
MKCHICGEIMQKTKGSYVYRESGLDNVVLTGITIYKCSCGEKMPEISNIDGLHRVIANALVKKKTPLSGKEVRFLRKQIGLSAKELAAVLGVNPVTVSRWENEIELIGPANDKLIRMLYIQMIQERCHTVIKDSILYMKSIKPKDRQKPSKIFIPISSIKNDPCLSFA